MHVQYACIGQVLLHPLQTQCAIHSFGAGCCILQLKGSQRLMSLQQATDAALAAVQLQTVFWALCSHAPSPPVALSGTPWNDDMLSLCVVERAFHTTL